MKYYIKIDSDYEVVREIDPSDSWDIGDDRYFNHQFSISNCADYESMIETKLEDPYFIFVIYETGCTFGFTAGNVQTIGATTKENALRIKEMIYNNDDFVSFVKDVTNEEYFYPSWIGYFESLENVVIIDSKGNMA